MNTPRLSDLLSHALLASLLVVVPATADPAGPAAPAPAAVPESAAPPSTPAAPEMPPFHDFARDQVIDRAALGVEPSAQPVLVEDDAKTPKKAKAPKVMAAAQTPSATRPTPTPKPTPPPTATRIPHPDDGRTNVQVMDVTVSGDQFDEDLTTGNVTVTGNPRVVRGDEELRATRIIINRRTQQVTAEGDVILRRGVQEFHASRATYNFPEQTGQADNVKSVFRTVYLNAEQIFFKPGGVYEYRKTKVTTCDKPEPHYLLSTRSVDVVPGERMIVHGAGFDLLGVRLITLPTFEKNLQRDNDERQSLIPGFGYDRFDGPYLRKEFTLRQKSPAWVFADIQLNAFQDPQGGVVAATPGKLQWVGSVFYRDVAENQRAPHLTVSRLPELGAVYTNSADPRPGRFLPNQIFGVQAPDSLALSQKWRIAASLTGGYFQQYHGQDTEGVPENRNVSGGRLQAQAQAVLPLLKVGPLSLNNLRLLARQSVYDHGDAYTLLGTGIGKRIKINNFTLGVDRFDQWTIGHTPFLFDRVELRGEWRPRIEYHTRGTNVSYYLRLRNEGGIYDQVVAVSHVFHCIEPRLSFSARRGEIFLEFRIPGLIGLNRSGIGEPRSQDTQDQTRPATRRPIETQPEQ